MSIFIYCRKKKTVFKFDGSSSALTLQSCLKGTDASSKIKEKALVCKPDANNVMIIFVAFMCFIEEIEQCLNLQQG